MYDLLRRDYYWLHMVTDVYSTVKKICMCPCIDMKFKHQRQLELFSPAQPLELVAFSKLGPLQRTRTGITFVVIIADGYSKLTRGILTANITSSKVTHIFFHN